MRINYICFLRVMANKGSRCSRNTSMPQNGRSTGLHFGDDWLKAPSNLHGSFDGIDGHKYDTNRPAATEQPTVLAAILQCSVVSRESRSVSIPVLAAVSPNRDSGPWTRAGSTQRLMSGPKGPSRRWMARSPMPIEGEPHCNLGKHSSSLVLKSDRLWAQ